MTIALVQQPAAAYSGGTVSLGNTFSASPASGNLIVFTVIAANNATITADDGTLIEIQTGYETFRRISTFAKIAGGSEPTTYNFTISASSTAWVYATEYSTTDIWDTVTTGTKTIDFDSSGANFEITSTGISTTAGSLLVAAGYSSNSTTANQEINTGFSNFIQPVSTGNTRRTAQADKTSAGGSQTAQFSLTDETLNNRLAVSLVEFTVNVSAPTVTQTDTTPEDGAEQTFNTTNLTGPITAASLGGKDILSLLSDTDPTTPTTYTLDVSATETSEGMPRIGETSTLSITATGGTATTDVVIQPKTGWAVETLAAVLEKDTDDFLTLADSTLGITTAIGDLNYYSNARGEVITAQGGYTGGTTVPYQGTEFVIQQGGSATAVATSVGGEFFPFGQGEEGSGPISSAIIEALNILSTGIQSSSI